MCRQVGAMLPFTPMAPSSYVPSANRTRVTTGELLRIYVHFVSRESGTSATDFKMLRCEVQNGVGEMSKTIFLDVQVPVYFEVSLSHQ